MCGFGTLVESTVWFVGWVAQMGFAVKSLQMSPNGHVFLALWLPVRHGVCALCLLGAVGDKPGDGCGDGGGGEDAGPGAKFFG